MVVVLLYGVMSVSAFANDLVVNPIHHVKCKLCSDDY